MPTTGVECARAPAAELLLNRTRPVRAPTSATASSSCIAWAGWAEGVSACLATALLTTSSAASFTASICDAVSLAGAPFSSRASCSRCARSTAAATSSAWCSTSERARSMWSVIRLMASSGAPRARASSMARCSPACMCSADRYICVRAASTPQSCSASASAPAVSASAPVASASSVSAPAGAFAWACDLASRMRFVICAMASSPIPCFRPSDVAIASAFSICQATSPSAPCHMRWRAVAASSLPGVATSSKSLEFEAPASLAMSTLPSAAVPSVERLPDAACIFFCRSAITSSGMPCARP
mmetsp:Transcript_11650/g.30346  ORF Transcript_11650/g.30346 Transcript_11650/m.30346 type:complete len:301 (-) Transcript_11650:491-1393(-)